MFKGVWELDWVPGGREGGRQDRLASLAKRLEVHYRGTICRFRHWGS